MAIVRPNVFDDTARLQKVIIDDLSYIKTVDCPIYDVASRYTGDVSSTFYWNYKSATAPTASNAKSHGATLTPDTMETETQFTQYTEPNAKTWRVNTTDEAIAKKNGLVGRTSEDMNLEKESRESLKMSNEWSFINGAGAAGANSPTASTMKGLVVIAGSGVATTGTAATFGAAAGETAMEAHLIAIKAAGGLRGARKLIYVSHTVKNKIKKWAGIATAVNTLAADQKIYSNVKVWDTQFGPIQIEGHDLVPDADVITLNPDELKVAVLIETNKGVNAVGKMFTEHAVENQLSIVYKPVASLGIIVLS